VDSIERTRTRHHVYLTPGLDVHSIGKLSFKYAGSKEIIDLPNNIDTSKSIISLKKILLNFLYLFNSPNIALTLKMNTIVTFHALMM
jgi:hypothetical protein